MVAAAIGGSAVIGAGTSLLGGSQQASGSAAAQKLEQQQMYDTTLNNMAFINNGTGASNQLSALTGGQGTPAQQSALQAAGLGSSLTFQPTQAQLASTPGYQFDLAQGQQATANSNAAQGRGISGAALKGAASYATGLANNTLTTQDQIFQNNVGNVLNPLQFVAGQGQASANSEAANNNAATSGAASAAAGQGIASSAGFTGAGNALSSAGLLYGLSNSGNSGAANFLTGGMGGYANDPAGNVDGNLTAW